MTNEKSKFKAAKSKLKNTPDGPQDIQETKEAWKLLEEGRKIQKSLCQITGKY